MLPRFAFLALLVVTPAFAAEHGGEPAKRVSAQAHLLKALPVKQGFQSIHNNSAGEVFVLTEDGYRVFAVDGTKSAVEKKKLNVADLVQRPFRVAFSATGGSWLLNGKNGEIVLVDGDDVSALSGPRLGEKHFGFLGSSPVVAGEPMAPPSRTEGPSIALVYSGGDWESLVREAPAASATSGDQEFKSYLLASTEKGRLWIVSEYEYRVRLASPQGRVNLDVRLPKVRSSPATAEQTEELQKAFDKHGGDRSRIVEIEAFPEAVIRAAASRSSDVYILWRDSSSGENRAFLDSVEPSGEVRRIAVEIPQVELISSMAAGKDGLYFAAALAEDGIFHVSWESLEAAPWQRVEGTSTESSDSSE